jgi:hypothetical protein
MCHAIGCACLGQTGHLQQLVASFDCRFGVPASVSSRDAVGSFPDRFRWPHPIGHDWPTMLHTPLAFSSQNAHPEPHRNIKSLLAQNIASVNELARSLTISAAMEFSGKDLEDIQRVAGLLNLTVDELLQQSRARSQSAPSPSNSPQQPSPQHGTGAQRGTHFPASQILHSQQHRGSLDLDLDAFDLCDPSSSGAGSDPSELSLPPPATEGQDAEVILLNPRTTWYDCDAAMFSFDEAAVESLTFEDTVMPEAAEDGSQAPGSDMEIDFESVSNYTAREEAQGSAVDDASTDWSLVAPSSGSPLLQTPVSPSARSVDKSYHRIAPKMSRSNAKSTSETSSHRVKKKRSPYEGSKRIDTHLTRQLHACVRCRMQRNRVRPLGLGTCLAELADSRSVSPTRPTPAGPA